MRTLILLAALASACWSQSVTQANMKISTVNGTAFIDFSGSDSGALTGATAGSTLVVSDHVGKHATGYIKVAGTALTFGSELLANTAFSNTTGVSASSATLASVAGGQTGNCLQVTITGSNGNGNEGITTVVGGLYQFSSYLQKGTGPTQSLQIFDNGGSFIILAQAFPFTDGTWRQATLYATADITNTQAWFRIDGSTGNTGLFDTASFKQVTAPSSTGVTITSTPGGTTFNWSSIDTGFNLNDTSGYTYTITAPGVAVPTFNWPTANYNRTVPNVTISDSTSGATICYTLDGTNPAASTPGTCSAGTTYSTAVAVPNTGATLKALGTKASTLNSSIASATYTVGANVAAWGDSLTQGSQQFFGADYPDFLAALTGAPVFQGGVSGQTSSQINTRFQAGPQYWGQATVIWAGRNDYSVSSTVLTNVAAMVADLPASAQYVVLSVPNQNSANEFPGQTGATQITTLNSALASAYPSRYLDVRAALLASYNPNDAEDALNYSNGVTPASLRATWTNSGTVSNNLNATDFTSFVFTSTGVFSSGATVTIDSEKIWCTTITTSGTGPFTYTCTAGTRGYAGTTATTHSSGTTVSKIVDVLHLGQTGYSLVAGLLRNWFVSRGILPSRNALKFGQ